MDVFYFNSPPAPAVQGDERSLKSKDKPSVKKRKLCSAMDNSPYHAHVVRVAEPTVYSNDLASLTPQYLDAFFDAGLFLPSGISSPSGDVGPESNTSSSVKTADRISSACVGSAATLPPTPGAQSRRSSAHHPRPVSTDLWEEEDGRRIRFALPGENDDHVERLRNSYTSRNSASSEAERVPVDSTSADDTLFRQTPGMPSRAAQPTDFGQFAGPVSGPDGRWPALPLPPPPPLPIFTPSQLLWDDGHLDVGDQKRSYDFTDFMDHWRLRARQDIKVPPFSPAIGPSEWRKPLRKYVRQHALTGAPSDLQGIRWESFGIERESALQARRLLHPERSTRNCGGQSICHSNDGPHYTFRSFAPSHRARFSHYQLRNMVAVSGRNDIYYADGSRVRKASLSCPSSTSTVMDLAKPSHSASPFKVTCLASSASGPTSCQSDDVLLAGGFNGEYALLDLNSTFSALPIEGTVSHAKDGIVNHISTFRSRNSASFHAAFCSNDHNIRIMDLHQNRFTHTFEYPTAINCSTMSPDSRLRALVHDGSDTWITNADTGEILVKLKAHTDFAFACAWSPCTRYLATGAEDGQTVIWDARNWSRPLKELGSVMSCPRSLHFTDDEKLVIAESEDVLSCVDMGTFSRRQDVRFFGSVAGVGLVGGGEEVVLANADVTVGGMMSFGRVAGGFGGGGFGERVDEGVWTGRRKRGRRREYVESVVEDVIT